MKARIMWDGPLGRKKIARVFPRRTALSPIDRDAYFGPPDLYTPKEYSEVHISVTFTWDLARAEEFRRAWEGYAPVVRVGGVAVNGESMGGFNKGMYLAKNVVITSRGCPNRCPWCIVGERPLKELDVSNMSGNIVQDNNLLACSEAHLDRVFRMLSYQQDVQFQGGLEAARVTDKVVERLRGIRIGQMFLAYDHPTRRVDLVRAVEKLRLHFPKWKIRCFVLIGFGADTLDRAEGRLREAWEIGTIPFAMLYRGPEGESPDPLDKWKALQKTWARPASIKAVMRDGDRLQPLKEEPRQEKLQLGAQAARLRNTSQEVRE